MCVISNIELDINNKMLDIIKWRPRNMKKYKKILFVLGILICLAGSGTDV